MVVSGITYVSLLDDDHDPGSVSAELSATISGNETGPTNIQYTVTLDKVNHTQATITFLVNPSGGTSAAGSDYIRYTNGVVSVPRGSSSGTYTVEVIEDDLFENTETAIAQISNPSN